MPKGQLNFSDDLSLYLLIVFDKYSQNQNVIRQDNSAAHAEELVCTNCIFPGLLVNPSEY